jgi:hypothetical protein
MFFTPFIYAHIIEIYRQQKDSYYSDSQGEDEKYTSY